ncbi:MAG: hypothetical protein J5992_01755 [Oscillospiraceae bacterium]|nr:hypothetical protein [Oscillospiraceae bacterium]
MCYNCTMITNTVITGKEKNMITTMNVTVLMIVSLLVFGIGAAAAIVIAVRKEN